MIVLCFTASNSIPLHAQSSTGDGDQGNDGAQDTRLTPDSLQTVFFVTNDGKITLEIPETWTDIQNGEWVLDEEDFGALFQASADLEGLYVDEDSSGIVLSITPFPIEYMSDILLLDWYRDLNDQCTNDGRSEFDLTVQHLGDTMSLSVSSEQYVDCNESDATLTIVEALGSELGIFAIVQADAEFLDSELTTTILQSIRIDPDDGHDQGEDAHSGSDSAEADSVAEEQNATKEQNVAEEQADSPDADQADAAEEDQAGNEDQAGSDDEADASETRSSPLRSERVLEPVSASQEATSEETSGKEVDSGESDSEDNPASNADDASAEDAASVPDSPAAAQLEKARELAAAGKVESAVAAFEEALQLDPELEIDPQDATIAAMIESAEALYFEDKTWQALQLYSTVLELDPSNADAYVGRASVYRWFEEYDKALADLSSALELGEAGYNYATAYSERGYIYYQQDDYERAIADLTRAIDAQSAAGEAPIAWYHELRGYALNERGGYDEAIEDFTIAIDLDESDYNYKWAYINRAAAYRNIDELTKALKDTTESIKIDAGYTWGYELRGRIQSDLGNYAESIEDLSKAIGFAEDDYDYSIAYGYRGFAYYQTDEYFEAVTDLTAAIELFPTYTWAYEIRGDAHSNNEQYEEAIADYTAAIELESDGYDYSSTFASRGIAYHDLLEFRSAVDDLTEAIRRFPDYAWAYEWRGYSYAELDEYENAIDDFTKAIEIDETDYVYKWAYGNRGHAYYVLGDYDAALPDLNKSIELDDEFAMAYELRGEVYGILGRYEEAMADLRTLPLLEPRSASAWNSLCWFGSLFGYAEEVADRACESAVELADEDAILYYRDSRGLARALTGNDEGALDDFKAFVEQVPDELRLEWIERLEAGESGVELFDAAMIQALFVESGLIVDEASPNSDADLDSRQDEPADNPLLGFSLEPSEKLMPVPPIGDMRAYSKDGLLRLASPGDPFFMVVPLTSPAPIDDPSDFALLQLELTANAEVTAVESHKAISINGLDGYETIATGLATSQEVSLLIYQLILFDGDDYLIFKGLVAEEERDEFVSEFQSMAESVSWP